MTLVDRNGVIRMKINEVIRKYRKEAKLTQEQVANYLGVTAPAVNKWENGISYPDITLLNPLARVLKINADTLLSYQEELTETEIKQRIIEVSGLAEKEGFQAAFLRGEAIIKEYPCCDLLILSLAQILHMNLITQNIEDTGSFEKRILGWYELTASSKEQTVASMAISALVNIYMEKCEYEIAQQLLDRIPPLGYDKRITQAILYFKQGKENAAYEIYERMIYQNALGINSVMLILLEKLIQTNDFEAAEKHARIIKGFAKLLGLGAYIEHTPDLSLALARKDKECSLAALESMMAERNPLINDKKSDLYAHLKSGDHTNKSQDMLQSMIRSGLQNDKELDFLRGESRFQKIMKLFDDEKG